MSQSSLLIATPNHRHNSGIPCPQEGRWPSSLTLGAGSDGRRLREDEPRGTRTAKACGPDAPTLASSSWEANASQGRRWQKSPVTGESTKETVKPSRRECRLRPVNLWKTTAFCAATGASDTRHSLRPLLRIASALFPFGGERTCNPRALCVARTRSYVRSVRSPHERSDMRVCRNPGYRFAHAGYGLPSLRANGSGEWPPDDRHSEGIPGDKERLDCSVARAPRNDGVDWLFEIRIRSSRRTKRAYFPSPLVGEGGSHRR